MEARQESLLDLLGEQGVCYALPTYQRAYAWGEYQCLELWRDVLFAARNDKTHFAGMLICATPEKSAAQQYAGSQRVLEVIDGQQRLTTLTLMLLAFARYAQEQGISIYGIGPELIVDSYLRPAEGRKLVLSRLDRDTLFALIDGEEPPAGSASRALANFRLFQEKMAEDGFDPELFWKGLRSVFVISIELGEGDNAQEIFESFNSKGVALTTADMMRNFLLMAENRSEQVRLYDTYWERIQSAFGDDPGSKRLNTSIRAWMCVRCKWARSHTDREMFSIFKAYCEEELPGTVEDLMQELVNFTQLWAERYRYHYTKAYMSYNWAVLGANTLVPQEVVDKVQVDRDSFYWKQYMVLDSTM